MQQRNQVSADTHLVEYIPFDAGEHFLMASSHQAHETVPAQRRTAAAAHNGPTGHARSALVHEPHGTHRNAAQRSAAARTALDSHWAVLSRSDRPQVWLAYYHNAGTEWVKANASTRGT
jgi:hypothetical protein